MFIYSLAIQEPVGPRLELAQIIEANSKLVTRLPWITWSCWLGGMIAEDGAHDWSRAGLDHIRAFLIQEASRGIWTPLPGLPL